MELEFLKFIGLFHNPILDSFFVFITRLADSGFIWIILSTILIINKKTRKYGFMLGIVLIVNLIVGEGILKHIFDRQRPFVEGGFSLLIENPVTSSFPSGHTASSFAVLGVFIFYVKKHVIPIGILATLIGVSRLYLQVHYPTDVIAGALIGLTVAYLVVKYITKKYHFFTLE